jgi:membrane protease YdiL (CAAX protease family)
MKHVMMALLLVLATYFVGFVAISALAMSSPDFMAAMESKPWVAQPVLAGVTLVVAILVSAVLTRGKLASYGFRLSRPLMIPQALLAGLILGGLLQLGIALIPTEEPELWSPSLLNQVLFYWVLASISEEAVFRGMFQGYLSAHLKKGFRVFRLTISLPALLAAILFALVHLALITQGATIWYALAIMVSAFLGGLAAGYFRDKSGSLVAPVIVHSLFNISGSVLELFR